MIRYIYPVCCRCEKPIEDETCICIDRYEEEEGCLHAACWRECLKEITCEHLRDVLVQDVAERITTPIKEEEPPEWNWFPDINELYENL